jgi:branched-chain amino acid transport system permease protein
MKRNWIVLAGTAFLLLIGLSLPQFPFIRSQPYWMLVAVQSFYYAILASSWALLAGYAGQFSFGHIAFMAIAAYTSGILGRDLSWHPILGIIAGTIISGFVGLVIGVLCLRLRKTYLALFTIAFAEIFRLIVNAEHKLTGGPLGLYMENFLKTTSYVPQYYIMFGLLLGSVGLMYALANSRFGLFFRSIREDEEAAAAMGVHVVRYKVMAFVITSAIAGTAGAVIHHFIGFIAPSELVIGRMSLVIAMAVIGGVESLAGAALGAIFIHFSLEWLQKIPLPAATMESLLTIRPTLEKFGLGIDQGGLALNTWRMVGFGILLMLTLRFWRNGLLSPILELFTRRGVLAETVAKRQLPQMEEGE